MVISVGVSTKVSPPIFSQVQVWPSGIQLHPGVPKTESDPGSSHETGSLYSRRSASNKAIQRLKEVNQSAL